MIVTINWRVQKRSKGVALKIAIKNFNKNIDSPFDNPSKLKRDWSGYRHYEKYQAYEILDKEKWDLIYHDFFSNIKREILNIIFRVQL